jgi:hypothetical protein
VKQLGIQEDNEVIDRKKLRQVNQVNQYTRQAVNVIVLRNKGADQPQNNTKNDKIRLPEQLTYKKQA